MTGKLQSGNANNVCGRHRWQMPLEYIERYLAGESINDLASEAGVTAKVVKLRLERAGIPIRDFLDSRQFARLKMRGKRLDTLRIQLDEAAIVRRYRAGETKQAIADSLGVNLGVIQKRLAEHGFPKESMSDAMRTRLSRMTTEGRKALTASAHDAVRGSKRSEKDLLKRAQGVQQRMSNQSEAERTLRGWLLERGVDLTPQLAIGKYNDDLL